VSPRRRAALGLVAAGTALAALYLWTYRDCLDDFFYLDDFPVMAQASHVRAWGDWWRIFVPATSFILYRPLSTVAYFLALRAVSGYDAAGYHAVQLAWHVANAVLVYLLGGRLLGSRPRGFVAALVYATAPGHALSACWIATFTMTGPAFFYLLGLLAWLRPARGRRARLATFVCFVLALLASEHALTFPVTLAAAALTLEPERALVPALREQAPLWAVAIAYGSAKLYYLRFVFPHAFDPDTIAFIRAAYGLTWHPTAILANAGRYFGHSIDFAWGLAGAARGPALLAGLLVVGSAGALTVVARRARARRTLAVAAFGLDLFLIALGPVVILRDHLFSYYVGTAAAGAAIAAVAIATALPAGRRILVPLLAAAVLAVHLASTARAVRLTGEFGMYHGFMRQAASWLYTLTRRAAGPDVREVVLPKGPVPRVVFELGEAHRLLLCAPYAVTTADSPPPGGPGTVVVTEPLDAPGAGTPVRTWRWLPAGCTPPDG
jgi:hypothetical protein